LEAAGEGADVLADPVLLRDERLEFGLGGAELGVEVEEPVDVDDDALLARAVAVVLGVLAEMLEVDHGAGSLGGTLARDRAAQGGIWGVVFGKWIGTGHRTSGTRGVGIGRRSDGGFGDAEDFLDGGEALGDLVHAVLPEGDHAAL